MQIGLWVVSSPYEFSRAELRISLYRGPETRVSAVEKFNSDAGTNETRRLARNEATGIEGQKAKAGNVVPGF